MNVSELIDRLRTHWESQRKAREADAKYDACCVDLGDEAAAALEAQARKIADCNRLRDDERLTWDAQHKRQASMNAHLAELVTDAQEELRKCQQDAIALQDKLTEAVALLREYRIANDERGPMFWCGLNQKADAFLAKLEAKP